MYKYKVIKCDICKLEELLNDYSRNGYEIFNIHQISTYMLNVVIRKEG
jgi:hypothetical protein